MSAFDQIAEVSVFDSLEVRRKTRNFLKKKFILLKFSSSELADSDPGTGFA